MHTHTHTHTQGRLLGREENVGARGVVLVHLLDGVCINVLCIAQYGWFEIIEATIGGYVDI